MQRLVHELQVHQIELEMQNAELRQSREDLETALERYTDLYDFAPIGYITLDRNGRINAVNLCGSDYLGIERATLTGRRFKQFVTEDNRPAFADFLDMVFTNQGKQMCEAALLSKKKLPLIVQIEAMATASGQECRLALIDITKRKRLDTELRDSEQKFRTLAHNAPDNIIRCDRQGRIVYINPRLELTLQRQLSDMIGKRPSEAFQGEVFDALEKVILDVAATGEDARFELILPNDDGPRTHLLHLTAERDPGGEVAGVLAIGRDITEQRRVEEKLKVSERHFRTLAENSPNIIIRYDRECRRVYVNQAYVRETGNLFDRAVGVSPEANWIPDMPIEKYMTKLRQTIETGVATELVLEWTRQDGQLSSHAFHVVAERDSQGKVIGCLAIAHNITALKEAELRLVRLAAELSLAEERERRRIASELHDQIGQTLLLSRIKLGTVADVFVSGSDKKTYEEIQSLLDQTIRDVRSLTQQLNPPVLAGVGLDAALEWLAKQMRTDYSLLVNFIDDHNSKKLTEELASVVYQSARELLINVSKHAGTNEAGLTISRDADMLVLTVEDQGVGFVCPPDSATNIPFNCSFGHFNIRQRIHLLGGSVMIESTPGSGTRATIRVPIAVDR